jgi:hypothetical protein
MNYPELGALRLIADKLIDSDPLVAESWDVDFSPCIVIAKAHLIRWSADVRFRLMTSLKQTRPFDS